MVNSFAVAARRMRYARKCCLKLVAKVGRSPVTVRIDLLSWTSTSWCGMICTDCSIEQGLLSRLSGHNLLVCLINRLLCVVTSAAVFFSNLWCINDRLMLLLGSCVIRWSSKLCLVSAWLERWDVENNVKWRRCA